jgi:isopenicillin N synthase-like dioxygenase
MTILHDLGMLQAEGRRNLKYPAIPRRAVSDAMVSWQNFCRMPRDDKEKFAYRDDAGYELKERLGLTMDYKENFQVTLTAIDRLLDSATRVTRTAPMSFIAKAHDLVSAVEPIVMEFAQTAEAAFDLDGFAEEVAESRHDWVFRYLHYFGGRSEGDVIAAAHADKSGFTLHLFETTPGLEYLTRDLRWEPMPVSPEETVVIPGLQMQLRSRNQLKATWHRVVSTPVPPRAHDRYSAVCFIPLTRTPTYNKRGVGRTQDLTPGFNYTESFEEFAELFR